MVPQTKGKYGLRVCEDKVLMGIFRPKRNKVAGGWRNLYNKEIHNTYLIQHGWRR
jgi:hypothetical protein